MAISKLLLKWYEKEGRDLPWRTSRDPYKIWVSEIILQQTRITQGTRYYHKFTERFPDVKSLAGSDITTVLNIWQGLGYYSRARNMHEAAKTVMQDYGGTFPETYHELIRLKGIGEYTAGAIASIVRNEAVPAIDGNVIRVISRLFSVYEDPGRPSGKKKIKEILLNEMDPEAPGSFNQALMDLGSMVCKPKNPLCEQCPLSALCISNQAGTVHELPVKYKKIKNRDRYFYYLLIQKEKEFLIKRRTGKDIWEMLFELPLIEKNTVLEHENILAEIRNRFFSGNENFTIRDISSETRHILSHQVIHAFFIRITADNFPTGQNEELVIVNSSDIQHYPLPRLIEKYLQEISLL